MCFVVAKETALQSLHLTREITTKIFITVNNCSPEKYYLNVIDETF